MYVSPAVGGCHRNSFYNCNYRVTSGINKLIIISLITWSCIQFSFLVP